MSILCGIGYAPGHPSRWAGFRQGGTTRLTVDGDFLQFTPLAFWRETLRLPAVRIPIGSIGSVSKTQWGLRFNVPGDPSLDGTQFLPFLPDRSARRPLIELLASRGIRIETMPVPSRMAMGLRNRAVASRPGWIWRDRGRLGLVETLIMSLIGLGILALFASFSHHPPVFALVVLAVIVALRVAFSLAGYRIRRRLGTSAPSSRSSRGSPHRT